MRRQECVTCQDSEFPLLAVVFLLVQIVSLSSESPSGWCCGPSLSQEHDWAIQGDLSSSRNCLNVKRGNRITTPDFVV